MQRFPNFSSINLIILESLQYNWDNIKPECPANSLPKPILPLYLHGPRLDSILADIDI
ncbi:hypothetical protein LguiB_034355 [Lonicera macranthoides]